MSGSGISWAICKSAPRSRQITTPAPHHSVFYRPDALLAAQPTASKHWKQHCHSRPLNVVARKRHILNRRPAWIWDSGVYNETERAGGRVWYLQLHRFELCCVTDVCILLTLCRLQGVMHPWFNFWFWRYIYCRPSVLWRCWLGGRKGIRPVKKLSGGVLAWLSVWS